MAASAAQKVIIDSPAAKWRFRCPNGHTSWETTNSHFWCASCASMLDQDPEYWELWDHKLGRPVPRDRIEIRE
jgi:hypothetical protein